MKKRRKIIILLVILFFILTIIGISGIYLYKDENITTTQGEITKSLMEMDFQISETFNNYPVHFDVDVYSEEDVNRRQNKDIRGTIHFERNYSGYNYRADLEVLHIKIYHENGQVIYENDDVNGRIDFEFMLPQNGRYYCEYEVNIRINLPEGEMLYGMISEDKKEILVISTIDKVVPVINSLTASTTGWTNKDVTLTGNAEDNYKENEENSGLYYYKFNTTNDETEGEWISTVEGTIPYEVTKTYTATSSGTYYFWVRDRATNVVSKSIDVKIDKIEPTISSKLTNTSKTIDSITMNVGAIDEISGFSKIEWYYKRATDSDYTLYATDIDKELNSEDAGVTTTVTKTKTIDNLQAGTYNVKAVIYDVAGNSVESTVETVGLDPIPTLVTNENVTFTVTPTEWTTGPVTVKATTNVSGYTLQVSTDNKNWENGDTAKFEKNGTIYVRLTDGTNVGGVATYNITNIDKEVPTITIETNGGRYTIRDNEEITIKTKVKAEDINGSGIKALQYAWSQSNTEEPTEWETITNNQEVSKSGIRNEETWYLWMKAIDNVENSKILISAPFRIIKEQETEEDITITYNYSENGGTSVTKETDTKKIGEKVDFSVTAKKDGYEFIGWNTNKNATTALKDLTVEDEDITLYAIFKKDIVLQFIDYAGTKQKITTKTLTVYNKNVANTTAPQINQYTGWASQYWTTGEEPDSTKTVSSGEQISNITKNTTYYARYSKTYTIKFDLNGGQGTAINDVRNTAEVNSKNINVVKNANVTIPQITATKEGYDAIGWNTKIDGTGIDYKVGEKIETINDVTLYIRWNKKQEETPEEPGESEDSFPEITVDRPDGWTNKNIQVKITHPGNAKIVKVTVNGVEIQPNSNNEYNYEITENGTYIIVAEDENNNTMRKEITVSTIDKTIPEITDIKNSITEEGKKGVIIELKLKDEGAGIAKVEYSYDGNIWNDCLDENIEKDFRVTSYSYQAGESTISMKWTEETNETIYFRAIDNIGNISEIRATTIKLDEENQEQDNPDNNEPNDDNNNNNNQSVNGNIDETISQEVLPFAGNMKIIVLIVAVSILSVITIILIKKYKFLKEVIK